MHRLMFNNPFAGAFRQAQCAPNTRSPFAGAHRHTDTQTQSTQTQTHRHTDTQTHRHTDTRTHRHTDTQTHRHTDTQTHRHTDTQTHRHTDTDTHTILRGDGCHEQVIIETIVRSSSWAPKPCNSHMCAFGSTCRSTSYFALQCGT